MEELLNKLIEKGWYPFCDNGVYQIKIYSDMDIECIYGKRKSDFYYTSYRKLTSKESGLWQFVCENYLIEHKGLDIHSWEHTTAEHSDFWFTDGDNYEYYIIESALCDEDKLEQFLLDNIKVEGK